MIIIDGRESDMHVGDYANLEEILIGIMQDDSMLNRIVTDVLVNDEAFSEIYPHQSEDISSDVIKRVEVRSMPVTQMARDITEELGKVVQMMVSGSRHVARLFRQAEDANALELLQDLLDVTRDFMNMLGVLRAQFAVVDSPEFQKNIDQLSNLLSEMSDVLAGEDWVLLADLLEYEFQPACDNWKNVIDELQKTIGAADK